MREHQIAQPIVTIGTVRQHHQTVADIAQQLGGSLDVMGLARCDDKRHRQAIVIRIGNPIH